MEGAFFFDVTKDDHLFRGWLYLDTWVMDENGNALSEITLVDGMVFKAKWEQIAYPIYYELDGGTNDEGNPASIYSNQKVTLLDAAKTGYLFDSWYADSTFAEKITEIDGADVKEKGSITVYAKYTYNSKDPANYPYLSFTRFNTDQASVKGVASSFSGETLSIPDVVTIDGIDCSVTKIEDQAFRYFSSINSIVYPTYLSYIGAYAFQGCTSLSGTKVLTAEDGGIAIGAHAFADCSSLQFVMISRYANSLGPGIFDGCHENLVIMMEGGYDPDLGYSWNSEHKPVVPYSKGFSLYGSGGTEYATMSVEGNDYACVVRSSSMNANIKSEIYGYEVMMIATNAFYGNDTLSSISLPSSILGICDYAFAKCSSLSSIFIPSTVEEVWQYAFYGDGSMTIRCQAPSKPAAWSSLWNPSGATVVWGASA